MGMVLEAIDQHFLFPSTLFVSKEQYKIQTILGSCVALCLIDEKLKWSGMNHYMLPWWNGTGVPSPKYGDVAIERLLEKMISMGSHKSNLVAKIFGGANQHAHVHKSMEIGTRNIETAERLLSEYGIKIISKNVGGVQGRKIILDTQTGRVFMNLLRPLQSFTE